MIWLVPLLSCIGLTYAEKPFNYNVNNERVIVGPDASPNTWKWQVSLQYDSSNQGSYYHLCGGSIIGIRFVMTAAHCILSLTADHYRAVVGEYNLNEYEGTEQFVGVVEIIVHPDWNGQLGNGNDIAILKLDTPIYDNGFVAIANLPKSGEMLPPDFTCYVTGWGLMNYTNLGDTTAILQHAIIKVVENKVCSLPDWWGTTVLRSMMCGEGDGVTSGCQGDSGGPLNCYTDGAWRVHGVVSYGPSGYCNQVNKHTVFNRVSFFLDWIIDVVHSY